MPKIPSSFGYSSIITPNVIRSARTANTILSVADQGTLIDITSGTFSQTFTAASTLGSGWFCYIRNAGTGDITLDPNSTELIDGLSTYIMYGGETRLVQCTGTAFTTVVLSPFYRAFTASGTFTKPPGYSQFAGLAWSGGGSGEKNVSGSAIRSGGGGGCGDFLLLASTVGTTETITIGAGGLGVTSDGSGLVGGNTTIGSLFTVFAGNNYAYGGSVVSALTNGANAPSGYEGGGSDSTARAGVWGGGCGSNNGGNAPGKSFFGAGAGGTINSVENVRAAGASTFGGAGGAASVASSGTAGNAPGGGGGATIYGATSGAGARGEVRIFGIA